MYDGGWRNGEQDGFAYFSNKNGVKRNGEWQQGKRIKWIGSIDDPRNNAQIDNQFDVVEEQPVVHPPAPVTITLTEDQIQELKNFGEQWNQTRKWSGTPE